MGSNQMWYICDICGFNHALMDEDNYTKCWHCDICGFRHSIPGQELEWETKNEKKAYAYVHGEWGKDVTPKEITIIKAKKLANIFNLVIDLDDDPSVLIEDILPYLRFKYKITNKYERYDKIEERFKTIIREMFSEEY